MLVYEYALVRFIPRVEREEFINVGLLLFCKQQQYIRAAFLINQKKLAVFETEIDFKELVLHLDSFDKIAKGTAFSSPISLMEVAERFRWLTAVKSSCIQTSHPHTGITSDLEKTFDTLFQNLIL